MPPLKGFPLELGIASGGQKLEWWGYQAEQEVWLYLHRVDIIHQRDRYTDGRRDGQTVDDSKDRAYT